MATATRPEMLEVVQNFVAAERKKLGMTGYPGPQMELSCIACGEFRNLLERHLLFTNPDNWEGVLADPEILEGVYEYVRRETEWEKQHAHA